MICQLVFHLKKDKDREAKLLGEILSDFYPEKSGNEEFEKVYEKLKKAIKKERGEELLNLSPFWYPVIFYLSLLNVRANTFLALKLLEEKGLLDSKIKRRQYKVFYIFAVKNEKKEKIFSTASKELWSYWFLLFNLVVSAPHFLKNELKQVGNELYKKIK